MECPKCHSILDDNQKVCPKCNKVLLLECPNCHNLGESAVCSKCGYTILVKCSKCSKITPYEKEFCSKCHFPLATSLAIQECESDEFASMVIKFESLKRIRNTLKSKDLYAKFLNRINNILYAQLKGIDGKIISYRNNIYEINFNKELSLATSANKAIRQALKIINSFVDVNSKIIEEFSFPLNLNISICKKNADKLQEFTHIENNVKLLNIKKDNKKFLKGFQIVLDQYIRDEVNKDYKNDSLYSIEENGKSTMYYEIVLDNYVLPPDTSSSADAIVPIAPQKINPIATQEDKDLYSFKVFDINAKCKFERTTASKIWDYLNAINFEKGGQIIAIRSEEELKVDPKELEIYLAKQDLKVLRVCCTEETNYTPWGVFKAIFKEYFNLPLILNPNSISDIDPQTLKLHKTLFELNFNKPVKAMSPEDARFTYMEAWSKFFKVLTKTAIIIEGFEYLDDTSIQTLELYFDKFLNVKANFIFITPNQVSLHSKIKNLLRTNLYTEFTLKRSTIDDCLSKIKSDATDFIQSFYYEKICNSFNGSYLYFQNALKYLEENGILINFENKLIIRSQKTTVLQKSLQNLYKSRIKKLSKNVDASLMLAYATILGPYIDFQTLEALDIKEIDKNTKILEKMDLISVNSNRIFINNYNTLSAIMRQSLKKEIEQFLAKTILAKLGKFIDDTTMIATMGILEVFKEEYLILWKNSQFALNTGDFDAYLKNCLGFLSLVEHVNENIPAETIENNKKEVFNNILMTLYAYSPTKIYFIENALLMDAINENDNEKIVKLSNLMLQGALISSNYTDAQGLLHNILTRMKNPTLIVDGVVNTKFLLLALVNIEILYNTGNYKECIEIAENILSILTVDIIDKIKPASFSTNLFVSHIMETLRLVGFAKIYTLENDFEQFFESIKQALGTDLPEKDCLLATKDFLSGKTFTMPNIENSSAFSKIIYLILQEVDALKDNYKQFAQNIYQAKLLALDTHQREIELFCDLLIAFAYSKISATEKAKAIYEDVLNTANNSALFNISAIAKYFIATLLIKEQNYEKATLIVSETLANIRKNGNQTKILFAIFEKLYINIVKAQGLTSVDIETDELKLVELKPSLARFLGE